MKKVKIISSLLGLIAFPVFGLSSLCVKNNTNHLASNNINSLNLTNETDDDFRLERKASTNIEKPLTRDDFSSSINQNLYDFRDMSNKKNVDSGTMQEFWNKNNIHPDEFGNVNEYTGGILKSSWFLNIDVTSDEDANKALRGESFTIGGWSATPSALEIKVESRDEGTLTFIMAVRYNLEQTISPEAKTYPVAWAIRLVVKDMVQSTIALKEVQITTDKTTNEVNDQEIKQIIINDVVRYPAASLTIDDIVITSSINKSPFHGQISLSFKIINNKAYAPNSSHVVNEREFHDIVISGFLPIIPSNWIAAPNQRINVSSLIGGSEFASEFLSNISDQNVFIDLVFNNKEQFFSNLPLSFSKVNIRITSVEKRLDLNEWQLRIETNKYYMKDYTIANDGDNSVWNDILGGEIILYGFRSDNTTTMINKVIAMPQNSGLATDAKINHDILKDELIKEGVIGTLQEGKTLEKSNLKIYNIKANDLTGELTCIVSVSADVAWINGVPSEVFIPDVKFIDFEKVIATSWKNVTDPIDASSIYSNTYPSKDIDLEIMKEFIANNISEFVNSPVPGTTKSDIEIWNDSIIPNLVDGTVTININLKKFYSDYDGSVVSNGSYLKPENQTFIIGGFKIAKNTTMLSQINLNNISEIKASDANINKQLIIDEIVNRQDEFFKNIAFNKKITVNDLEITFNNETINNVEGSISANVTLKNNNVIENGVAIKSKVFNTKIKGFKQLTPTSFIDGASVDGSAVFSTIYATEQSITQNLSKINQFVKNNLTLFVNHPLLGTGDNENDIILLDFEPNTEAGSLKFNITLNKYLSNDGKIINPTDNKPLITSSKATITGFKTNGLNTTIVKDTFNTNLNIKASEATLEQFKEIIGKNENFKDLVDGVTVNANDILLEQQNITINDKLGVASISTFTLTNNKAKVLGTPSDVSFGPITINNFVTQNPTEWATNKNIVVVGELTNRFANTVTTNDIKSYVISHLEQFVLNLPNDFSEMDLEVSEPTNVNITNGALEITITIKKYYDENNGLLITNNKISPTFTLKGFKTNGLTTIIEPPIGISGLTYASDYKDDLANVNLIQAIIDSGKIIGVANGQALDVADIVLSNPTNINDITGEMSITITLINNKYWFDGVSQSSHDFLEVLITGFKTRTPTSVVNNTTIEDPAEFKGKVNAYTDEKIKTYIQSHINKFFNNTPEGITQDNFTIQVVSRDKTKGEIQVGVTLKKYYNSTNGLLELNGDGITGQFVLKGFEIQQDISTSMKSEFKTITYNSTIFNEIFGNDKGFIVDWNKEKVQKESTLKTFMNDNIAKFLTGYYLVDEHGMHQETSVNSVAMQVSGNNMDVTITFDNWFIINVPTKYSEKITIELKPTPKGNTLVKNDIQSHWDDKGNQLTVEEIKQIIADSLNKNLNNLPNVSIPASGQFVANDITITDANIQMDNETLSITPFSIGIGDGIIEFEQMEFNRTKIYVGLNWILAVITGSLAVFLILLFIILTMNAIRKRKFDRISRRMIV